MPAALPIRKTDSIFDELTRMQERIMRRAYDIFEASGGSLGRDLENWLDAERQLVWRPAIELSEKDQAFHLSIAVPGVDPKIIDIEATEDYLLVKAEIHHEHSPEKAQVHLCEFEPGSLFRSVRFPKKIDPNTVKAEFQNGMLYFSAQVAEEAKVRHIEVKAS